MLKSFNLGLSRSSIFLLAVVLISFSLNSCRGHVGQPESETHGGGNRAAHEKFQDEHYKGGEHDEHLDHEAVLGSKKEAETFDQLSQDESRRRLRLLVEKKMDADKDGSILFSELETYIARNLELLDKEEVEERFNEIDEDNDDFVTWDEYKKDAFGETEVTDSDDLRLMQEDRELFKSADKDQDNKLDIEEFGSFQNPEHHPHMHDSLITNTLNEKDKNKDGLIDLDEFLGEYADKKDSEWYASESARFKEQFDKNKDGKLDKEEMKTWLIPNVLQTAKDEAQHLFNEADVNKDGVLTPDEIVDAHALFVGSEATNYGEHLEKMRHDEL